MPRGDATHLKSWRETGKKPPRTADLIPGGPRGRKIRQKLFYAPESLKRAYVRACRGELSPMGAIRVFCLECQGWDRKNVPTCAAEDCPLWVYRCRLNDSNEEEAANNANP